MNFQSPVVWQPVPALPLCYAVESDAPAALAAARRLFSRWLIESSLIESSIIESSLIESSLIGNAPLGNAPTPLAQRWRIEADGKEQWRVADAPPALIAPGEPKPRWSGLRLSDLLTQIEYATLAHLVAHLPPEFIGLHGALLSRKFDGAQRAVIVVGPKEAGKSTLACALWRAGWHLHCDDFTLLDAQSRAHPTARRVSLRSGSRELLGALWQQAQSTPCARSSAAGLLFHPHEIDGEHSGATGGVAGSLNVGAICFLKRRGSDVAPAQSAPVGGIEAAFALLPYTTLLLDKGGVQLSAHCADWGVKLGELATRLTTLSLHDVGRGQLAAMVRKIERLVDNDRLVTGQESRDYL